MKANFSNPSQNQSASWTNATLEDLKGIGMANVGTIFRAEDTIIFPSTVEEADLKFQTFKVTKDDGRQEDRQVPLMKVDVNGKLLHVALASFRKMPYGSYAQDFRLAHPVNDELLAGDFFDLANKLLGRALRVESLAESKKAKFVKGKLQRDSEGNAILEDCKLPVWKWVE
jgi:hypothetical protein